MLCSPFLFLLVFLLNALETVISLKHVGLELGVFPMNCTVLTIPFLEVTRHGPSTNYSFTSRMTDALRSVRMCIK